MVTVPELLRLVASSSPYTRQDYQALKPNGAVLLKQLPGYSESPVVVMAPAYANSTSSQVQPKPRVIVESSSKTIFLGVVLTSDFFHLWANLPRFFKIFNERSWGRYNIGSRIKAPADCKHWSWGRPAPTHFMRGSRLRPRSSRLQKLKWLEWAVDVWRTLCNIVINAEQVHP